MQKQRNCATFSAYVLPIVTATHWTLARAACAATQTATQYSKGCAAAAASQRDCLLLTSLPLLPPPPSAAVRSPGRWPVRALAGGKCQNLRPPPRCASSPAALPETC